MWDLSPSSAVGLDGYPGSFYRRFWQVIHQDVFKAVQEFYLGVLMPQQVVAATIILISKVQNPQTFVDFKPICLTNFVSKVITRLISTWLGKLLPQLISPEQAGFMKGRGITE